MSEVYNLAADMGGMGFLERNRARCMVSVLINTNLLRAAREGAWSVIFSPVVHAFIVRKMCGGRRS